MDVLEPCLVLFLWSKLVIDDSLLGQVKDLINEAIRCERKRIASVIENSNGYYNSNGELDWDETTINLAKQILSGGGLS